MILSGDGLPSAYIIRTHKYILSAVNNFIKSSKKSKYF